VMGFINPFAPMEVSGAGYFSHACPV
jgi:hypothetical protein